MRPEPIDRRRQGSQKKPERKAFERVFIFYECNQQSPSYMRGGMKLGLEKQSVSA